MSSQIADQASSTTPPTVQNLVAVPSQAVNVNNQQSVFSLSNFARELVKIQSGEITVDHEYLITLFSKFYQYFSNKTHAVFSAVKEIDFKQVGSDAHTLCKEIIAIFQLLLQDTSDHNCLYTKVRVITAIIQQSEIVKKVLGDNFLGGEFKSLKLHKFLRCAIPEVAKLGTELISLISGIVNSSHNTPFSDTDEYIAANQKFSNAHTRNARKKYSALKVQCKFNPLFIGNKRFIQDPMGDSLVNVNLDTAIPGMVQTLMKNKMATALEVTEPVKDGAVQVLKNEAQVLSPDGGRPKTVSLALHEFINQNNLRKISPGETAIALNEAINNGNTLRPEEKEKSRQAKLKCTEIGIDLENLQISFKKVNGKSLASVERNPTKRGLGFDDVPFEPIELPVNNSIKLNIEDLTSTLFIDNSNVTNIINGNTEPAKPAEAAATAQDLPEGKPNTILNAVDSSSLVNNNFVMEATSNQVFFSQPQKPIEQLVQEEVQPQKPANEQEENYSISDNQQFLKDLEIINSSIQQRLIVLSENLTSECGTLAKLKYDRNLDLVEYRKIAVQERHDEVAKMSEVFVSNAARMIESFAQGKPYNFNGFSQSSDSAAEKNKAHANQLKILSEKESKLHYAEYLYDEFIELQSQLNQRYIQNNMETLKTLIMKTGQESQARAGAFSKLPGLDKITEQLMQIFNHTAYANDKFDELKNLINKNEAEVKSMINKNETEIKEQVRSGVICLFQSNAELGRMLEKISQQNQIINK